MHRTAKALDIEQRSSRIAASYNVPQYTVFISFHWVK